MTGVISISKSMLDNDVWRGPYQGEEGLITILSDVDRIIFPKGVNVKGLIAPNCREIILGDHSRVRHLRVSSHVTCLGNFFCADMDLRGDLVSTGNIVSWLTGISMPSGSIYAEGSIRSAGPIHALAGVVYSGKGIEGETKTIDIRALDVQIPGRKGLYAQSQIKPILERIQRARKLIDALV